MTTEPNNPQPESQITSEPAAVDVYGSIAPPSFDSEPTRVVYTAAPQPVVTSPAAAPAMPRQPAEPEAILYIPLAVTVGDGFKFGCGFFLALGVLMTFGFVLLSALFVLSSMMGINLPVGR